MAWLKFLPILASLRVICWIYAVEMGGFPFTWLRRGLRLWGWDISKAFLEDAKRKAEEHKVSNMVSFLEGGVRNLKKVLENPATIRSCY